MDTYRSYSARSFQFLAGAAASCARSTGTKPTTDNESARAVTAAADFVALKKLNCTTTSRRTELNEIQNSANRYRNPLAFGSDPVPSGSWASQTIMRRGAAICGKTSFARGTRRREK